MRARVARALVVRRATAQFLFLGLACEVAHRGLAVLVSCAHVQLPRLILVVGIILITRPHVNLAFRPACLRAQTQTPPTVPVFYHASRIMVAPLLLLVAATAPPHPHLAAVLVELSRVQAQA